jgi:hypothetical protein
MLIDVFRHLMKYVVFGIILYLLVTYIPTQQIKNLDQIIIYLVALLSFIILDLILNYSTIHSYCSQFMGWKQSGPTPSCGCDMETFKPPKKIEHLTLEQPQIVPIPPVVQVEQPPVVPVVPVVPIVPAQVEQPAKPENQMKYTEFPPEMHQPLGTYDNTFTNDFNHGYTLLNTDKWAVPMKRPPVCIQEKECPVCPTSATMGYYMSVTDFPMEFKMPEKINTQYVANILNK